MLQTMHRARRLALIAFLFLSISLPVFAQIYKETQLLPDGRAMHGAAVLGDFLYVISGTVGSQSASFTQSVILSRIMPGGQLGPWQETTPLPRNRHYIAGSTIALDDVLYVIGGKDGLTDEYAPTAYWARPRSDGQLGHWEESSPFMSVGRSFITVVAGPGHLHLIGGMDTTRTPTAEVISGVVAPGGAITSWIAGPSLPEPLWWHHAAAVGGRVWVWGGLPNQHYAVISNRVYSAPILASGQLGPWVLASEVMPVPYFGGTATTAGSFLLAFCPRLGPDAVTSDVWYSVIGEQGLSQWSRIDTGIPNRIYQATAPDYRRGTVYFTGGKADRGGDGRDPRVFFFELSDQARQQDLDVIPDAVAEPPAATMMMAAASSPTAVPAASAPAPSLAPGQPTAQPTPRQYTWQSATALPAGAIDGFMTYEQARRAAANSPSRPMILFFHHPQSRTSRQQVELLQTDAPALRALLGRVPVAWIDVAESPQLAQQLGVFRAPMWSIYDRTGRLVGTHAGTLRVEQLEQAVASTP